MKKSRFLSAFAVAALAVSMASALPASAAGTDYTPLVVDSTTEHCTTTFDKYLAMKNLSSVPNVTFTYTVAAGTQVAADDGKLAVLAGPDADAIKIYSGTDTDNTQNELEILSTDETMAEAAKNGYPVVFETADTTDEKFVRKVLTVDLSGVTFTEPGIYRYIITESGDNQGVTNGFEGDGNPLITTRTLDVYVKDNTSAANVKVLEIEGYVLYKDTVTAAPNKAATQQGAISPAPNGAEVEGAFKSQGITNYYGTQSLTLGKEVIGNQGSKDKYFKFTVTFSNVQEGTVYTVDLANADATSGTNSATKAAYRGQTNPVSITVPNGETSVSTDFYLQDGQYITIHGLAKETEYSVTEDAEDYNSIEGITSANNAAGVAYTDAVSGDIENSDVKTGYTNERTGAIPTGVILSIAGPAVVGLAVVGGIVFLSIKRKREDQED